MLKIKTYNLFLITFLLTILSNSAFSQYIQSQQTAEYLINNVLAGGEVQISNITISGDSAQIGEFGLGDSVGLSINRGIVMTTGNIPAQLVDNGFTGSINSPAAQGTLSTSFSNAVDGGDDIDLNTIIGSFGVEPPETFNKAVIEFDFIPNGNSLKFNYVFGSEEYENFVCSEYFDCFGFFISGPGINGPYTDNAQNIAIVPGTNLPVSMNTINNGFSSDPFFTSCPPGGLDNQAFFVDSSGSQNFGVYSFTTILTAEASVTCGETYHIKLVIANGSDTSLDSWVWLEAESFNSSIIPDFNTGNLLVDSSAVEGCTEGTLIFENNICGIAYAVPVTYSGTATPGVDYIALPDTIFFAAGQPEISVPFVPVLDNLTEPVETVIITFTYISESNDTFIIERTIKIRDQYELTIVTPDLTFSCPQNNLTIQAQVSGGYPPYSYLWEDDNQITPTINVPVGQTTTFVLQISDVLDCTFAQYTDSVVVTINYDSLTTARIDTLVCPETTLKLVPNASSGALPYTYEWPDQGIVNDTLEVTPTDTTIYVYSITDACNVTLEDTIEVFVPETDILSINVNDTTICKNGVATLYGIASGGTAPYTYVWTGPPVLTVVNDSVSTVNPPTSSKYLINLKDNCNNNVSDTLRVTVQNCELNPGNAFSPNGDGLNDFFKVEFIEFYPNNTLFIFNRWGNKVYEKAPYNNEWNGDDLPSGTYFYAIDPGDGSEVLKGFLTIFQK